MDRKSDQKIIKIVIPIVIFIVSMLILLFCAIGYESRIRQEQMQELTIIYPEIEEELIDNFAFYQTKSLQADLISGILLLFLCVGYFLLLLFIWKKDGSHRMLEVYEEADVICEQLRRFHKDDFTMLAYFDEMKEADMWNRIHEQLRELGYYFSALKEQLADEQNSTKALITDISHQLKTPLASIRMSHELAKTDSLSDTERKEFLEAEEREINKLEELLAELVNLSRLESNMIQLKPEKRSLQQTISEAVSQIFMKAYGKNIEIFADIKKDVQINHDKKWTVEAFANILDNAVKYSDSGTSIFVRVEGLSNHVLIEIEDEGMGIEADELHKIFRRFYRGSNAKKSVKEGAGVGLYLSRSIIEQQGGTILAKRKTDRGTIFKIMLPLH